jgi:hypothetical protein
MPLDDVVVVGARARMRPGDSMTVKRREPPVATIHGLRPPLAGFPYFEHAERFPFEPAADVLSLVNAWWLADASFLAYGDASFVEQAFARSPLPAQGYALEWLGSRAKNRGFALVDRSALVVVFRGTRLHLRGLSDVAEFVVINQSDLWFDSLFLPTVHEAGGRVHSGFLKAFREVAPALDRLSAAHGAGRKIWLTGHSLGGALATLAAAHLGAAQVQGLFVYGSPRVGDAAFARVLAGVPHLRFEHRDDWVVNQPPEFLGYVDAGMASSVPSSPRGELWDEFKEGARALSAAAARMARALHIKVGDLPFTVAGLADHMPIHYAVNLWNALVDEKV